MTATVTDPKERAKLKLEDVLGADLIGRLQDPELEDMYCNPDGSVWINLRGKHRQRLSSFTPEQALSVINAVAAINGAVINYQKNVLQAILPFGRERFHGMVPPIVPAPSFAIRTRPRHVYTLQDYVSAGALRPAHAVVLRNAIQDKANILIVGGTGSGKTTLLNSCLAWIAEAHPDDRIVTIEDTGEVQCNSSDHVPLLAIAGAGPGEDVTMLDCLLTALRLNPTRIIVGEVRGAEALQLLNAWNTGHPGGLATIHANSATEGLVRLASLVRMTTAHLLQQDIVAAVNIVVFIARDALSEAKRKIQHIVRVKGWRDGRYITEET